MYAARDGVDATPETQEIETLVGFADAVLRVDSGDVGVPLLDCLLFVSLFVFCFFGFWEGMGGGEGEPF